MSGSSKVEDAKWLRTYFKRVRAVIGYDYFRRRGGRDYWRYSPTSAKRRMLEMS